MAAVLGCRFLFLKLFMFQVVMSETDYVSGSYF